MSRSVVRISMISDAISVGSWAEGLLRVGVCTRCSRFFCFAIEGGHGSESVYEG